MKRERECRSEERVGGKGSTDDNELQTNQNGNYSLNPTSSPVSPVSSSMSPVSPPISPVSCPRSPVSSTRDQVQATLPSSPPLKQGGYFHYGIAEIYRCTCQF